MATAQKRIHIQYFALLREERGASTDTLETSAATPLELYSELQKTYHFTLNTTRLSVAINDEFGSWDQPLQAEDTIVFIPPVAGG